MDGLILLLQRFTFRHWRQAPRTTLLLGLTLALGVAVFLSIRMANRAALSGFSNFTELITAESDFIIQPRPDLCRRKRCWTSARRSSPLRRSACRSSRPRPRLRARKGSPLA